MQSLPSRGLATLATQSALISMISQRFKQIDQNSNPNKLVPLNRSWSNLGTISRVEMRHVTWTPSVTSVQVDFHCHVVSCETPLTTSSVLHCHHNFPQGLGFTLWALIVPLWLVRSLLRWTLSFPSSSNAFTSNEQRSPGRL